MTTVFSRLFLRAAMALFVVVLLCSPVAWPQAVSQISGTVTDGTGAAVPGVEITVTQTQTGAQRRVTSDAVGAYVVPNLPLGPYRLEASSAGFNTYVQTGIQLQVNSSPVVPIALAVGQVSETIEVAANASQVETRNMGVGAVVENQRIVELPLNGRNPTDLITLSGAAVETGASPAWAMKTGVQIQVAGGQSYGVGYSLDGAQHTNTYDATGMPLPFPDALQEFKIETSSLTAQNGSKSGAAVSGVTKSGSNEFHGDAFWFVRNRIFNARNFFAPQRDNLKRNQFGGTIGGPIKADKLFFFFGYQGTLLRQQSPSGTSFIPTAQMLAGDFRTFASPQCQQGRTVALRAPFVDNQISPALFSPAAVNISKRLPPTADPCGQIQYGLRGVEDQHQYVGRVDYQINDRHSFFGRYMASRIKNAIPYELDPSNNPLLTTPQGGVIAYGQNDLATSVALGETWLVSPTTINTFRVGLNRVAADHPGASFFGARDVGINAYSAQSFLPVTVVGGFAMGNVVSSDLFAKYTHVTVSDDFSVVRGSHQFSFGATAGQSISHNLANVFANGIYVFTGQFTGTGMTDFFTGTLGAHQQSAPNPLNLYQRFLGLYAQDTWRASSRLTLNLGVRWEPFFPMNMKDGRSYTFDIARHRQGIVSEVIPNAPAGFNYPGDPGYNGTAGIRSQYKNFQPRIGIAFDPTGSGRTSIRAGAGMAYDFVNQMLHHNTTTANPFGGRIVRPAGGNFDDPWGDFPGGNPFPYTSGPGNYLFTSYGSFQPVPVNLRTPRVISWNLAVQQQVTQALFASVSYVGNQAYHLLSSTELNPAVLIPGLPAAPNSDPRCATLQANCASNSNQRRVLSLENRTKSQFIGLVTPYDDGATQNYHGFLFNTTWRPTSTVNVNANYTWSHCIGDYVHGNNVPNPGQSNFHYFDRSLDRGNCDGDRRHIFNLTSVAQTPDFGNSVMGRVASGWTVSVILRAQSGAYLAAVSGVDAALLGNNPAYQRPDQVADNVFASNKGQACANVAPCVGWIAGSAFAQPALGTFGNAGRNNIAGPGLFGLDMAVTRQFPITESQSFEIRAEAFNLPNNTRFLNPETNLSNANTFGVIRTARDPRIMQFAAKYIF